MGTKVQCKSSLVGYSLMMNGNEDSSNIWSSCYEDKSSNVNLYNGFVPMPLDENSAYDKEALKVALHNDTVNEYSGHDKEMIKQTMLGHEAIFRSQVYELHRLYRTQKDLMDRFKEQSGISHSCYFPSKILDDVKPSLGLPSEPFYRVQDNSSIKYEEGNEFYFTNSIRDEAGCSNFSDADDEKTGQEWPSFNYEHGQLCTWSEEKSALGIESYCKDLPLVDFNNSALTNSLFGRLPSFSSLRKRPKIEYVPIVIQALPCFPASYKVKTRRRKPKQSKNTTDVLVCENSNIGASSKFSKSHEVSINLNITNNKYQREVEIPSYASFDTLAAESLLAMSMTMTPDTVPSSFDSLNWFVNVISSELTSDDFDRFETLTLKLEEMKQDEYINLPMQNGKQSKKDENHLGTKKCKTRTKKLKKNKDFQKDILPSIISLSRKEVKEDFHAFDCFMRSIGETWDTKLWKQKGKIKLKKKNKKRKSNLVGWGKKTKRGPRPRVKPSNAATLVI